MRQRGSRGGHRVAVARRGPRATSTDLADEIAKAGTLRRRPPSQMQSSSSRVKDEACRAMKREPGTSNRQRSLRARVQLWRQLPAASRKCAGVDEGWLDNPRRNTSARSALAKKSRFPCALFQPPGGPFEISLAFGRRFSKAWFKTRRNASTGKFLLPIRGDKCFVPFRTGVNPTPPPAIKQ